MVLPITWLTWQLFKSMMASKKYDYWISVIYTELYVAHTLDLKDLDTWKTTIMAFFGRKVWTFILYKPGAPALPGGLKSYFKGDPDIQIYQLNNSLQYQRGSHARHMHFWSSFEPSRLILKLWNENVRPKKLD